MVSSLLLGICFLVLLTKKDEGIRLMSFMCLSHLLLENAILVFFTNYIEYFDFGLYLNITTGLDILLVYGIACVVSGLKKKILVGLSIPFLLCQVFILQYPTLFPSFLFSFSLSSAYISFMESFIFVSSFAEAEKSVKEWLKLSIILFCLMVLHFTN